MADLVLVIGLPVLIAVIVAVRMNSYGAELWSALLVAAAVCAVLVAIGVFAVVSSRRR